MDSFHALSDATRRQVIETLRTGEQPVNDIVGALDIHQSGVSRHLRILRNAGFVQVRPSGQRRLYSLRPERFRELDAWIAGYRGLWDARLARFDAALEASRSATGARPRSHEEK